MVEDAELDSIIRKSTSDRESANKSGISQQLAAWAGILAPIIFTALVIIESFLRPGYSQVSGYISDLGVGRNSVIQNSNFILFGILSIIFALGFGRALSSSTRRRARSVIIGQW